MGLDTWVTMPDMHMTKEQLDAVQFIREQIAEFRHIINLMLVAGAIPRP